MSELEINNYCLERTISVSSFGHQIATTAFSPPSYLFLATFENPRAAGMISPSLFALALFLMAVKISFHSLSTGGKHSGSITKHILILCFVRETCQESDTWKTAGFKWPISFAWSPVARKKVRKICVATKGGIRRDLIIMKALKRIYWLWPSANFSKPFHFASFILFTQNV